MNYVSFTILTLMSPNLASTVEHIWINGPQEVMVKLVFVICYCFWAKSRGQKLHIKCRIFSWSTMCNVKLQACLLKVRGNNFYPHLWAYSSLFWAFFTINIPVLQAWFYDIIAHTGPTVVQFVYICGFRLCIVYNEILKIE